MILQSRLVFGSVFWEQNLKSLSCMLRASLIKHFCSNSEVEGKDLSPEEWLKDISSEMESKKKIFESELQIMQESGMFTEFQLTARDWKRILVDCNGIRAFEKFLSFREDTMYKERSEKERKRLSQEAHEARMSKEPFDADIDSVYSYTRNDVFRESRIKKHSYVMSQMNSPVPVVFDMDYSVSMREEILAFNQIQESLNVNRMSSDPCAIHLTSYTKNQSLDYENAKRLRNRFVTLHDERFDEVFPVEKLVYLSPNAPELVSHKPGDIYVIGGLVDLKNTSHVSLEKARRLKIKNGSLPFSRHSIRLGALKNSRGSILTLDKVMELVLAINLHHNWAYVMNSFKEQVSGRKRFPPELKRPRLNDRHNTFLYTVT